MLAPRFLTALPNTARMRRRRQVCLFLVLYVPVVAQFNVEVRAIAAVLLLALVVFVARPAVDPTGTAGRCGIPVATRMFAVRSHRTVHARLRGLRSERECGVGDMYDVMRVQIFG